MGFWTLFIGIAIIITLAGFVQSAMGFGYAIVALAVLPLLLGIRTAHIVVSISMILPLAAAVWAYRHGIDWSMIVSCLVGASVGLLLGLVVFSTAEAAWLVRATGVVILLLALDGLFLDRHHSAQPKFSPWWSGVAGAAGGLLSGSIGIGGPPIVAFAARQRWSPLRFKAFLTSVSLLVSLLKGAGLAAAGWLDHHVLLYSTVAVPFGLVGCQLGIVLSRNINARRFRQIAMSMLLVLSVGMIVRGQPSDVDIDPVQAVEETMPAPSIPNAAPAPRYGESSPASGAARQTTDTTFQPDHEIRTKADA